MMAANFEELKKKANISWGMIFAWSVLLAWTVFYVTSWWWTAELHDKEISIIKSDVQSIRDIDAMKFEEFETLLRSEINRIEEEHSADIDYFNGRLDRKVGDVESLIKSHESEKH